MFICSVQPGAPLVSGTCAVLGFAGMVVKVSGYVPVDSVGTLGLYGGPKFMLYTSWLGVISGRLLSRVGWVRCAESQCLGLEGQAPPGVSKVYVHHG